MKGPLLVRPLTDAERRHVEAGLRSSDALVLRRCQILLASARGEHARPISQQIGCSDHAVRNVIRAFHRDGLGALTRRSSRAKTIRPAFDAAGAERLRDLLHRRPREFGQPTTVWTLPLAAAVSATAGLTGGPVSGETVRATLARWGVRWQRAKHWLRSPDPAYARKQGDATA